MSYEQLQKIGWPYSDAGVQDPQWRDLLATHPQARPARIVEQHRSGYLVDDGVDTGFAVESLLEWRVASHKRDADPGEDTRPAVGDWLLIEGAANDEAKAVVLLPRHSAIKRGAAGEHYKQQIIAANVDTVFIVCGLDADFNPRRIERYLMLVGSGATPVILLTKADKEGADAEAALAALSEIATQDIAMIVLNAKDIASIEVLAPWLGAGRTVVLVGSSGAGKSTLTNTLLGIDKMKIGEVRASDARGRHTTTHRALIPLPSGACLIDTPGMRELKPTGEEEVGDGFADIEALTARCRFRDCKHSSEPGCAVAAALASGELDPVRYAHYLKLRDEVAAAADKLATRLAQKSEGKTQGKALNKRLDEKYGRH